MSIAFSGIELINVAIGIEEKGLAFYDVMARTTDDESTRAVFENLADTERRHIVVFKDMLGDASRYETSGESPEEYVHYLRALIDSAVFSDEMISSELVIDADSPVKALELGISAEKDSILFYYGMKDLMPPPTLPTIDRIIAEEKTHLRDLSEARKRLLAT